MKYGLLMLFLIGIASAARDKPALLAGTGWEATGWYNQAPGYTSIVVPMIKEAQLTPVTNIPGPTTELDWAGMACSEIQRKGSDVWIDNGCHHNIIVNGGKDMATGDLFAIAANGTNNVWNKLALGLNTSAFAVTDTALSGIYTNFGLEIATATLTRVAVGNVSSVYTWTCTADGKTITAAAMYNTTNSILAAEAVVTSATLNNGDKLTLTYYGAQT
jgi:hypothetical protein